MSDVLIPSRINVRESAEVKNGEVLNHRLEHMCQECESWVNEVEMVQVMNLKADEVASVKIQLCAPCVA